MKLFTGLVILFALAGCTSKDDARVADGGSDAATDAPQVCTSNADCDPHAVCRFAIDAGCGASGTCRPAIVTGTSACPLDYQRACGCEGRSVWLYGQGACDSPEPISNPIQACGAGAECATDSDCGRGLTCLFAVAEGCAAKGACVDLTCPPGAACGYFPDVTACACNGSTVNVHGDGDGGLPRSARVSIAHEGPCDAGADASLDSGDATSE